MNNIDCRANEVMISPIQPLVILFGYQKKNSNGKGKENDVDFFNPVFRTCMCKSVTILDESK